MTDYIHNMVAQNGPDFSWVIPLIVFLVYIIAGIARYLQQMKQGSDEPRPAKQAKRPRDVQEPREKRLHRSSYGQQPAIHHPRQERQYAKADVKQQESQWQKLVRQTEQEAKAIAQTGLKSAEIQQTPEIKSMEQAMRETEQTGMEVPNLTRDVARQLQKPQSLRKAVIFSEIIKPPVSMRGNEWF